MTLGTFVYSVPSFVKGILVPIFWVVVKIKKYPSIHREESRVYHNGTVIVTIQNGLSSKQLDRAHLFLSPWMTSQTQALSDCRSCQVSSESLPPPSLLAPRILFSPGLYLARTVSSKSHNSIRCHPPWQGFSDLPPSTLALHWHPSTEPSFRLPHSVKMMGVSVSYP